MVLVFSEWVHIMVHDMNIQSKTFYIQTILWLRFKVCMLYISSPFNQMFEFSYIPLTLSLQQQDYHIWLYPIKSQSSSLNLNFHSKRRYNLHSELRHTYVGHTHSGDINKIKVFKTMQLKRRESYLSIETCVFARDGDVNISEKEKTYQLTLIA